MPQNNNIQNNPNFDFINNINNTNNSNINTQNLENIFNVQSNNSNNNSNAMNNQENSVPTLIPQQPKFNIEQVYENTAQLKQGNKSNDPFNFVDDLLKKK